MGILFTLFYQPMANLLFFLMSVVQTNSIMFGILALVIVVKLVLFPLTIKNSETQRKMADIAEELKEIKEKVEDKKEQMEKTLEVYKKAGVNPLSPIILLIIQIPFFIAIFFVLRDIGDGLFQQSEVLYDFISGPTVINQNFLFIDVYAAGGVVIALLVGITQHLLARIAQKKVQKTTKKSKIESFSTIMSVLIAVFAYFMTATVGLYWLFNNMLSLLQEIYINHKGAKEGENPEVLKQSQHPEG